MMPSKGDMQEDFTVTISWHSAIKEFLLVRETEGQKADTLANAKSALNRFSEFCIGKGATVPAEVSKAMLRAYLRYLQGEHAASYVNGNLSKIRSFYEFLCEECDLPDYADPTLRVKFLKTGSKLLVVFNDDEVLQLINAAGKQRNKFHAERDKLILMMLADCGLRVNELCCLREKDVTDKYVFIAFAKGSKQRMVYLTPAVARQVLRYRRVRDAYFEAKGIPKNSQLFRNFRGEPIRNDGVQKLMKRLATRCTIRPEVRVSPHTMRHWFAMSQLQNGVSIFTLSKLLGHSSINTTQIYLQGLADEVIVNSAIETSPLLNIKNKQKRN